MDSREIWSQARREALTEVERREFDDLLSRGIDQKEAMIQVLQSRSFMSQYEFLLVSKAIFAQE